ncbi:HutD family protein [Fusobacterium sp. MFO224]|uniref:HutD family protein n=1 Tax=Fusobacterium sp. MFO224 TaxID=3378070 RepID=UPI0038522BDF
MFKILSENQSIISKWSGGITKQLYIYPENCEFKNRDFKFRISTATTELEESTFTSFNNMNRVISVLKGTMELNHLDHHHVTLNPYDIDRFSGNWTTHSKGKVTDFNLIINNNGKGDFYFKEITNNEVHNLNFKNRISFIYAISGEISINDSPMKAGELAVFDEEKISFKSEGAKLFYGYVEI